MAADIPVLGRFPLIPVERRKRGEGGARIIPWVDQKQLLRPSEGAGGLGGLHGKGLRGLCGQQKRMPAPL
jgi:hypothetical protein